MLEGKFVYKGNTYYVVETCKMKTGFLFWRKWVDAVIYRSVKGSKNLYVRSQKEFIKKFKGLNG